MENSIECLLVKNINKGEKYQQGRNNYMKYIFALFYILLIFSCRKNKTEIIHFYDKNNNYIGDSIFENKKNWKVIYIDSTLVNIDSTIYSYNSNYEGLKSIKNFNNGNKIFECNDYFPDGKLKYYSFRSLENEKCGYGILYNNNGEAIEKDGSIFFNVVLTYLDEPKNKSSFNKPILIKIYHPNPPNSKVNLYIMNNEKKNYLFHQSQYLSFLKYVIKENYKPNQIRLDTWLEIETDGKIEKYHKYINFNIK